MHSHAGRDLPMQHQPWAVLSDEHELGNKRQFAVAQHRALPRSDRDAYHVRLCLYKVGNHPRHDNGHGPAASALELV